MSLDKLVKFVNEMSEIQARTFGFDLKYLEKNNTNQSGSPAYKEINITNETSTITGLPTNGSKVLYIVTIRNGTAYTIDYIDSSDKFSKHLPGSSKNH